MLPAIIALIVGLILLVLSADRFVVGASSTASRLGMKPLFIGMFVVGFGTSAPEILVSALAALDGSPSMALGNAFGSNIANMGLILGVTALVSPIVMSKSRTKRWPVFEYISGKHAPSIVKREIPIMLSIIALTLILFYDGHFSLGKNILLLILFLAFVIWSYYEGRASDSAPVNRGSNEYTLAKGIFWLVFGLTLLIGSSRLLVWGAVTIALDLGISEMMVGLTIVAVGTSLPELASSLVAARRGEHDIAIGNVLGSNIFNSLAVVGIAGVIQPFSIDSSIIYRDLAIMFVLTLVLNFVCSNPHDYKNNLRESNWKISRKEGAFLLIIYMGYTAYLIWEMVA